MKKCIICGAEFEPKRENQITCGSQECKDARKYAVAKERRKQNKQQKVTYTRICKICGVEFTTGDSRKIYHNKECQYKACKKKMRENKKLQIPKPKKPETRKKTRYEGLREATVKARKMHMSYGQYVAMQEGEKHV